MNVELAIALCGEWFNCEVGFAGPFRFILSSQTHHQLFCWITNVMSRIFQLYHRFGGIIHRKLTANSTEHLLTQRKQAVGPHQLVAATKYSLYKQTDSLVINALSN